MGFLTSVFLTGAFYLGFSRMFLNINKGFEPQIDTIFSGFDSTYTRSLVLYLLRSLIVFLWSLLLIIPGIIASMGYMMSFFILADEPELSELEILAKSKRMMYGHKMRLFTLLLSFFGWFILCLLTLGIGFLWLIPYIGTSLAVFYTDLKENHTLYEGEVPLL